MPRTSRVFIGTHGYSALPKVHTLSEAMQKYVRLSILTSVVEEFAGAGIHAVRGMIAMCFIPVEHPILQCE